MSATLFPAAFQNTSTWRSNEEKASPRLPLLRRAAVLGAGTIWFSRMLRFHLANAGCLRAVSDDGIVLRMLIGRSLLPPGAFWLAVPSMRC